MIHDTRHAVVALATAILPLLLVGVPPASAGECEAQIAGTGPGYYYWSDCSPVVCSGGCGLFEIDRGELSVWFCDCQENDPASPSCCTIVMMEFAGPPYLNYPAGMGPCKDENGECPDGECTVNPPDLIGDVEYWTAACQI